MFPFAVIPPFVATAKEVIKQVCCTSYNTALLTSKGNLYVTGQNRVGELGVGDNSPRYNVWVLVMSDVAHIAGNRESLTAFRKNGTVWAPKTTTGTGQYSWVDVSSTYTAAGDLSGDNIKQVISDSENTIIWKKDLSTWYIGRNGTGQSGGGDRSIVGNCRKMTDDVKKIAVGGSTVVVLKTSGLLYGTGSDPRNVISSGSAPINTFTMMFGTHTDGGTVDDFSLATGGQAILVRYSNGKYRTKGLNIGQLPSGTAAPGDTLTDVPDGYTPGGAAATMVNNIAVIQPSGTYPNYSYALFNKSGGDMHGAGAANGYFTGVNQASGTVFWAAFDSSGDKLAGDLIGMSYGEGWLLAYSDKQVIYWGGITASGVFPIPGYIAVGNNTRPAYRAKSATLPIIV